MLPCLRRFCFSAGPQGPPIPTTNRILSAGIFQIHSKHNGRPPGSVCCFPLLFLHVRGFSLRFLPFVHILSCGSSSRGTPCICTSSLTRFHVPVPNFRHRCGRVRIDAFVRCFCESFWFQRTVYVALVTFFCNLVDSFCYTGCLLALDCILYLLFDARAMDFF